MGRPKRELHPLGGKARSAKGVTGATARHSPNAIKDTATSADALDQLLRGDYLDPDGGPPIARAGQGRAHRAQPARTSRRISCAPLGLGRRLAVVSDPATRAVLGARVERALSRLGTIVPVVLEPRPHADLATVATLRRACGSADALVAVGSGTINDLCKYAAAKDGKPYIVFATAPSMNGYTSMNAAITVDGHKKTLPASTPLGGLHGSRGSGGGAAADDSRRSRRFALPAHGAGRLAAVPSSARHAVSRCAFRDAGRRRGGSAGRARSAPLRRSRRDAGARAHARAVRPRNDDLRRQLSREPGRASHQPLHRHVRAARTAATTSTASRWRWRR